MNASKISFDDRVKPKNVLALNEKVAAIRRYEVDPVYKSVGRHFHCSPDQIKRIIKQKNEILAEWNNRTRKTPVYTTHVAKSVKMSFIGRAVYEWIRRMMYYTDFNLTDALIQTMCLEFKKELNLLNFFPNKGWIMNFRKVYELKDVNTRTLDVGYHESHSVQIRDIVRHLQTVCGSESEIKEEEAVLKEEDYPEYITPDEPMADELCLPSCSSDPTLDQKPMTIHIELRPSVTPAILPVKPEPIDVKVEELEAEPPQKVINTHEEAIKCVKLLEDLALLKENFRLIGLIERLEEALVAKK